MADTIGGLVDKLCVVSLKMWWAQENLYHIRHQTFEQFKEEFMSDDEGAKKIWDHFKKACDLNLMRNQLIDEIDQRMVEMIDAKINGEDLDNGKFVRKKYKSY